MAKSATISSLHTLATTASIAPNVRSQGKSTGQSLPAASQVRVYKGVIKNAAGGDGSKRKKYSVGLLFSIRTEPRRLST